MKKILLLPLWSLQRFKGNRPQTSFQREMADQMTFLRKHILIAMQWKKKWIYSIALSIDRFVCVTIEWNSKQCGCGHWLTH